MKTIKTYNSFVNESNNNSKEELIDKISNPRCKKYAGKDDPDGRNGKYLMVKDIETWSDEQCDKFLKLSNDLDDLILDLKDDKNSEIVEKDDYMDDDAYVTLGGQGSNKLGKFEYWWWFYQLEDGWRGDDGTSIHLVKTNDDIYFKTIVSVVNKGDGEEKEFDNIDEVKEYFWSFGLKV